MLDRQASLLLYRLYYSELLQPGIRPACRASISSKLQVREKPESCLAFALLTTKCLAILRPAGCRQVLGVTPQTYGCGSGSIVFRLHLGSPVGERA